MWSSGFASIFDQVYALDKMVVWNHNQANAGGGFPDLTSRGLNEAFIEYSIDAVTYTNLSGAAVTTNFHRSTSCNGTPPTVVIDFGGVQPRHVLLGAFAANPNFPGAFNQFLGLSEARFYLSNTFNPLPPINHVVINEFMASNIVSTSDDECDEEDWIELLNPTASAVNLDGWYLTDDSLDLAKWRIPAVTLNSGEGILIFASNKNRTEITGTLHTNFRLSQAGEYLALVAADGITIVDDYTPHYPVQVTDVSYGIDPSDGSRGYLASPTPGFGNTGIQNPGLALLQTGLAPIQPANNDDVVVTASFQQIIFPIQSINMNYRVMFGSEITVVMADDGNGQDVTSGDGIFTGVIPASSSNAGQMVRWYFEATDSDGQVSRWPQFKSVTNSPEYFGTMITDSSVTSNIPILQWFVENPAAALTDAGTRCSAWFNGEFYDNFFVRRRGFTTASWPKRKFKFDFNRNHHFRFLENIGRVEEVNLQSHQFEMGGSNTSYMRETIGLQFMRDSGVTASQAYHIQLRQNGSFYGLYSLIEQIDTDFLQRNGFPQKDALMYKAAGSNSAGNLRPNPSPSGYRISLPCKNGNFDALTELTDGVNEGNTQRSEYLFDNINLPQVINEMAAHTTMLHHDRLPKNYSIYRNPETLEWSRLPFDIEQAFALDTPSWNFLSAENYNSPLYGDSGHPQEAATDIYNHLYDAILDTPATREMYVRRLRTLMDDFLEPSAGGYFEQLVNNTKALIEAEADADNLIWGAGNIDNGVNAILNTVLPTRRNQLFNIYGPGGTTPLIPAAQAGNPQINIGVIEFNPTSGNQDEEYIELLNPNSAAVDVTGWRIEGGVSLTMQPGTVIPANSTLYLSPDVLAFRNRAASPKGGQNRFVQGPYCGHLSNFGEELILIDDDGTTITIKSYVGAPSLEQLFLRVTELHFHPAPATAAEQGAGVSDESDFEFIEFQNISTTATLDLSGVKIIDGVIFNFSGGSIATLAPGAIVLVIRNISAFQVRYGTGLNSLIAGEYLTAKFSNDGERIKIDDGTNSTIQEFDYNDNPVEGWPDSADGLGPSMIVVSTSVDYDLGSNWTASNINHGTPGLSGPGSLPPTVLLSASVPHNGFATAVPVDFTVTFSRPVSNFQSGDIQVTNGIVVGGSFSGSDGDSSYSFSILPADLDQLVSVLAPAASAQAVDDNMDNLTSEVFRFTFGEEPAIVPEDLWILY